MTTLSINIDDPNAVTGHVWAALLDNNDQHAGHAVRTFYEGVEGQCATVTINSMELAVGYDPNEDGILWAINWPYSDGTRDVLHTGGWAPGDTETAEREIASIISVMNDD